MKHERHNHAADTDRRGTNAKATLGICAHRPIGAEDESGHLDEIPHPPILPRSSGHIKPPERRENSHV